ncbi:hypothetical protein KNE206_75290 [Kitasatospora sp. NE20-6]
MRRGGVGGQWAGHLRERSPEVSWDLRGPVKTSHRTGIAHHGITDDPARHQKRPGPAATSPRDAADRPEADSRSGAHTATGRAGIRESAHSATGPTALTPGHSPSVHTCTGGAAATRKPVFPVELSGVLELRAATR